MDGVIVKLDCIAGPGNDRHGGVGVWGMQARSFVRGIFVAAVTLSPAGVFAQTVLPSSTMTSNGVYIWLDGSYRSVNLPDYSLGVRTTDATFSDLGPVQSFKPRVTGEGINGGIGFVLPEHVLPTVFGSNTRIGLTGSYVEADAKQTGYAMTPGPVQTWLDGTLFFGCGCEFWSELATKYSGWRLGLNAASDVRIGAVTWTPSIEIVTNWARTRQTLTQIDSSEIYTANTKLNWSDVGIKLGLGMTLPVAPTVEFGLSGTIAVVHRRAHLRGNDALADIGGGVDLATSIDTSAHTWAVVPGAQVQLLFNPAPQMQIRAFGGVERDSRVPGIVSPHFTPDQFFTFMGSSASIGFSGQTSYFAGGGFTYAFNR